MSFGINICCMTRAIIGFGVALVLTACVTTERGGVGSKADEAKALDYSMQLARQYVRSRKWDYAKRHIKAALEIDDSSPEVYEILALVFQNTGELKLAEQNFKKSIKLDGNYSRGRNNYAVFLYQQGQYKEAVKQLEIIIEDTLYENRVVAFENLGRCYLQLGALDKAEKVYQRAYLMNRNNVRVVFALADIHFQKGDYPRSQTYYDSYRRMSNQQSAQGLWLGIQLAKVFDDRDALSSYVLVLKNLYPTSQQYLDYKRTFANEQ